MGDIEGCFWCDIPSSFGFAGDVKRNDLIELRGEAVVDTNFGDQNYSGRPGRV
jgi:hypothetical protein